MRLHLTIALSAFLLLLIGCDTGTTVTTAAPENGAAGGADPAQACELIAQVDFDAIVQGVDLTDPDSVREAYEEALAAADQLVEEAPDEIQADAAVVSGALTEYLASLDEADFDPTAADNEILTGPEVQEAMTNLRAFADTSC